MARPARFSRLVLPVAFACGLLATVAFASVALDSRPRNVILMIPDGCGPSELALARMVLGRPLALDSILVGACETASADDRITDSAAGATALACGVRTRNRALGLDAEFRPVGTLLEAAQARGLAVGLVTTSRVTHATPAAFAAHVRERDNEDEIALEELAHGIDVVLGGGRREFLPESAGGTRRDGRDLLAEAAGRGVAVARSRADLARPLRPPALGLFTGDHMSYELDRDTLAEPGLEEMTRAALAALGPHRRGFFLMVEGGRVDHAAHGNDAAAMVREIEAFDRAVTVALDFARGDGRTLVLSVSDHETGGMTLGVGEGPDSATAFHPEVLARARASAERMAARVRAGDPPERVLTGDAGLDSLTGDERAYLAQWLPAGRWLPDGIARLVSRRAGIGWTTWGHTAADVGLHACGPGAARFRGVHPNTDVARILADLLGLDLGAVTARLRRER